MKRRDFLKKLGIVCGAAIACPTELLKKRRHPGIYKIDHPVFRNVIKTQQNDIPYGIPYWCGTQQHFMSRASGFIIFKT